MKKLKNGQYEYSYNDLLGTGSFGSVFKCKDTINNIDYALKIVCKKKLNAYGDYLHIALEREIETQRKATESKIPFFVGLYDNFEDEDNIYIILEYCEKSLMDFLYKVKLNEMQSLELIFQVALGLNYLHSVHITHRDIKPENILMKKGILKIADFGFASNSSQLMTNLGTAPYMSPELFLEGDEAYTPKVDVWALNTCLYKLLTGKLFYWSPNKKILEKQVIEKPFYVDPQFKISDPVKDLLIKGYMKNPSQRLSMQEYVNHPAFSNFHQKYFKFLGNPNKSIKQSVQPQIPVQQEQKPQMNMKLFQEILNFRNNSLEYSFMAQNLFEQGMNKIICFMLLKKTIQYLTGIVISFQQKIAPSFYPFNMDGISQQDWQEIIEFVDFQKLIALYIKDLIYLTKRYSELFKNIQLCANDGSRGVSVNTLDRMFDLNTKIDDGVLNQFLKTFLENQNQIQLNGNDRQEILKRVNKLHVFQTMNPFQLRFLAS